MKRIFILLTLLITLFQTVVQAQIQAGSSLQILIQGVPTSDKSRIDGMYPVSEVGTINMPYIGVVRVVGTREDILSKQIEGLYKNAGYYTSPTIQVSSTTANASLIKQEITVGGQVARPGPIPYTKDISLYQAIQAAGGATPFGNVKKVKVYRNGVQQVYDLTNPAMMEIRMMPKDTIEIPQKLF